MHQNKARWFLTEGLPVLESVLLTVKNSIEMKARLLSTKKTKSNISCLFFSSSSFFLVQPNLLLFLFVVLMSDGKTWRDFSFDLHVSWVQCILDVCLLVSTWIISIFYLNIKRRWLFAERDESQRFKVLCHILSHGCLHWNKLSVNDSLLWALETLSFIDWFVFIGTPVSVSLVHLKKGNGRSSDVSHLCPMVTLCLCP